MSLINVILFVAGAVLIYSGVKNVDPRDVIRDSVSGKDAPGTAKESSLENGKPNPQAKPYIPDPDSGNGGVNV